MLFAKDFLMNQRPILGEVILWHLGQCEVSTQDIMIMYNLIWIPEVGDNITLEKSIHNLKLLRLDLELMIILKMEIIYNKFHTNHLRDRQIQDHMIVVSAPMKRIKVHTKVPSKLLI